jgi:4-hydroxybenzoate polyprenyltransferase
MSTSQSNVLEIGAQGSRFTLKGLLGCMRPAQWIKNGFVLAPLVFAAKLNDLPLAAHAFATFAAFCLAASGVYLWNDTLDAKADRFHPEKKMRPIPSGQLSGSVAALFGSIFLAAGIALGLALSRATGLLLCSYAVINILYAVWLKHMAIIDLMCIAAGFVLRVVAGATAINVEASHWLLMCTFLLALFLGVAKRRHELGTLTADSALHRPVLGNYTLLWLDQVATVISGVTIVAYALYTVAPETQARFGTDRLIYTVPFVIYGILRYLHLIQGEDGTGNPTGLLLKDKPLVICIIAWVIACAAIIY